MASRTYADRQTYTRVLQCSHASVGLAQARPNKLECVDYQQDCVDYQLDCVDYKIDVLTTN